MTTFVERPTIATPRQGVEKRDSWGRQFVKTITSTDHKRIGYLYLATSFTWFLVGGVLALFLRAELTRPGMQFLSNEQYNQIFTMHGTIMLLMFATPLFVGFANVIMPLQIGAADVAFPRLNMLSYWLYLFGGTMTFVGFLTPGGAASFGWTAYAPLSNAQYSPGIGGDLWLVGLAIGGVGTILGGVNFITTIFTMRAPGMTMFRMSIFSWNVLLTSILVLLAFPPLAVGGIGTILGAVNFITTIFTMRAPGMTMFRMSIFSWNVLLTSILVLLAFPPLAVAFLGLEADRLYGTHLFDPANGGAMLWQHLFWFFGHPEVYILALPFFGIATEILPVFSRKPIFGYKGLIAATIAISALSVSVWAHHMFASGQVLLPFFSFMTFLIGVPTGVKFFNWIGTMWRGHVTFETPMLWVMGFLVTFLFGGLTGIILASPPLDFAVSASYFVVAHFHYVLFGTVVFAMFAGFYFWWPKMTGRMLNERLGKIHFWTLFFGFHLTFLIQHWLGIKGFPRRYADYLPTDGFTFMNTVSTIGSFLLALSMIPFFINVWITRKSPLVGVDDPWGYGSSLEWATSCPPPRHNFTSMPRISSERPAFDLHHPHIKTEGH